MILMDLKFMKELALIIVMKKEFYIMAMEINYTKEILRKINILEKEYYTFQVERYMKENFQMASMMEKEFYIKGMELKSMKDIFQKDQSMDMEYLMFFILMGIVAILKMDL